MLFDWFTFGAQTLNFLVLVWLLKRFLYKPILNAIDEREQRIVAELADAEAKQAAAQLERAEFQRKNAEFDSERTELIRKATNEANAEGERLSAAVRAAADALATKRSEALRSEARSLNQALTQRAQAVVFQIARKTLSDLATTSLEERVGEVFTRRLHAMSGEAKALLAEALSATAEPALIQSAFELPAQQQAALQRAVNETFSADVQVRFEVAPNVISGIELSCGGQKVGWSIREYLASLEHGVAELLEPTAKAAPNTSAASLSG